MPTMIVTIRKLIGDESVGNSLEQFLRRGGRDAGTVRGCSSRA